MRSFTKLFSIFIICLSVCLSVGNLFGFTINSVCDNSASKELDNIPVLKMQSSTQKLNTSSALNTTNSSVPQPENVTVQKIDDKIVASWDAPSPEPADYTYYVELVNKAGGVFAAGSFESSTNQVYVLYDEYTIANDYKAQVQTVLPNDEKSDFAKSELTSVPKSLAATNGNSHFTDIAKLSDSSKAAINWAYIYNVTGGYTPTSYKPERVLTRSQMATFLRRLAGSASYESRGNPFSDINNDPAKDDILWLAHSGVTGGYECTGKGKPVKNCRGKGDRVYQGGGSVTREQMSLFLYALAGRPDFSETKNPFVDTKNTQAVFKTAILWLVSQGIVAGYDPTHFRPTTKVNRNQMALFMKAYAYKLELCTFLKPSSAANFSNASSFSSSISETLKNATGSSGLSFITKITFADSKPKCDTPIDFSADESGSIILCITGEQMTIGQNGGVFINPDDNSALFSYFDNAAGVEFDLGSLIINNSGLLDYLFAFSKIKNIVWPAPFNPGVKSFSHMFFNSSIMGLFPFPSGFGQNVENIDSIFANSSLPDGFTLPAGFGENATTASSAFNTTEFAGSFALPNSFGAQTQNIDYIFVDDALPNGFSLPAGFGQNAKSMIGSFNQATLPNGFTLPAGFGQNATNVSSIFEKTAFPNDFALPEGFGEQAEDSTYAFFETVLPNNFALPEGFGVKILNMDSMFERATIVDSISFPDHFGGNALHMADMFKNAIMQNVSTLNFPTSFGDDAQSMSEMFYGVNFPNSCSFPDNFGTSATDMSSIFEASHIKAYFTLPSSFGINVENLSSAFANATIDSGLSFPEDFGAHSLYISKMFNDAQIGQNINWSRTNFAEKIFAEHENVFQNITWGPTSKLIVMNQASSDVFTSETDIDPARIQITSV
ncbi:MAG: S-layer homology domain-containing protein [Bifidobacteriaceae bacterium]|jgi:hypothetical protein|nr:S-layer homology domain-containing protein [Bifidobacteriaceae bacterium]